MEAPMADREEGEFTVVDRPFDPSTTRKKRLRTPEETVRAARKLAAEAEARGEEPGAVVHSEGHTTENAARSAVKRIHSGRFLWGQWKGSIHAYVVPYDDGTWGVAITWTGPTGDDDAKAK
jgi:hypothetical protein